MEQKGIALTILGIVAIIAIVGLVLLFTGVTGRLATSPYTEQALYTMGAGGGSGPTGPFCQDIYDQQKAENLVKQGWTCTLLQTFTGQPYWRCCQ